MRFNAKATKSIGGIMNTTMTNELPTEIMENGIHYTLVGDYYFPTCNGQWAALYERYLREKHPQRVCQADLGG